METKRYGVVLADPAWQYDDKAASGERWAGFKYETMPTEAICQLPVRHVVADDCALFLWATWPMISDAFQVMKAWGFNYSTAAFVWVKTAPRSAQEEARRVIQRGVAQAIAPALAARSRLEGKFRRGVGYCLRFFPDLSAKYEFEGLAGALAELRKLRTVGAVRQVMAGFERGELGGLFWGMGQGTRTNTEVVLMGIRGRLGRESAGVHQVVLAPPGRHSEKPVEVHRRIEALLGDRPRLELFARRRVRGWDVWGNEIEGGSDVDLHALARANRNGNQLDLEDLVPANQVQP
jgi:N6-adenosine-specific RNA methylase IME4